MLSLSRLVRDRMLRRRLPKGSRESSLWGGRLESLMILLVSLYTAWCRCPGGRKAHLQQCGGKNAEELEAVYPLHRCLVNGDGCVFSARSPEIHHQLLGLVDVE